MEGLNPSDSKAQAPVQSHPHPQVDNTSNELSGHSYTVGGICGTRTSQQGSLVEHDTSVVNGSATLSSSDSESDDEDTNYAMGYAPLSQDPELNYENEDDTCLSEQSELEAIIDSPVDAAHQEKCSTTLHSDMHIEQTSRADSDCVCSPVAQLEDNQVDKIKQAMSGFTLPSSVIPEWAKQVPENVWKSELINGIRTKKDEKQSK